MSTGGLLVSLADPDDVDDVRAKMLYHAASLQFGNVHLKLSRDGVSPSKMAEEVAAKNTALLATLLAEHLRASHGR